MAPMRKAVVTFTLLTAAAVQAQRADTVVRTASRPVHAGVATLEKEITIGVADGDEHYMLGAIADVAVGPTGNIYVWDRSVPAIRMYDRSGKYLKTIGKKGSGPGEYQAGAAIAVARNGNLLMWDPGNARINVYTSQGDVVTTWPTRSGGSGSAMGRGLLTIDTAGTLYLRGVFVGREAGKPTVIRTGWIRLRPDGSFRDTLFTPPSTESKGLTADNGKGQFSNRAVPFMPRQLAELSPLGYLVTGMNDRIALDVHEPGKPIVSIRRTIPLRPVSSRERDSARAEMTAHMRSLTPNWSWNGPEIPRTKPAYEFLSIDGAGRMWVQLDEGPRAREDSATLDRGDVVMTQSRRAGTTTPALEWSCPSAGWSLFDVFEPTGRYLGQVRIPARIDPIVMRGDFIWAATCNDDDVPSVVRYRIAWR
jgi:hypothetical protein